MAFQKSAGNKGYYRSGAQLADLYLPVKINGDSALLKAFEKLLLEAKKTHREKYWIMILLPLIL